MLCNFFQIAGSTTEEELEDNCEFEFHGQGDYMDDWIDSIICDVCHYIERQQRENDNAGSFNYWMYKLRALVE